MASNGFSGSAQGNRCQKQVLPLPTRRASFTQKPYAAAPHVPVMEERRQKLAHMFNNHTPVSKTLGSRLHYQGETAILEMPYKPAFDTAGGNVHGGIGALALDSVMVRF